MRTEIENTKEAIVEYLENLSNDELLSLYNIMAREYYPDDEIYYNDEYFFNVFFENRVLEAVRAVSFGEYNYSDTYVKFNGYANLETFNDVSDEIDISELAEYIKEHPEDFDDIELTNELEDFIRESYEKVKYVWKKSPSKYYVYKEDEEIYFIDKFHTNKHWLDRLGTLDVMYGELD